MDQHRRGVLEGAARATGDARRGQAQAIRPGQGSRALASFPQCMGASDTLTPQDADGPRPGAGISRTEDALVCGVQPKPAPSQGMSAGEETTEAIKRALAWPRLPVVFLLEGLLPVASSIPAPLDNNKNKHRTPSPWASRLSVQNAQAGCCLWRLQQPLQQRRATLTLHRRQSQRCPEPSRLGTCISGGAEVPAHSVCTWLTAALDDCLSALLRGGRGAWPSRRGPFSACTTVNNNSAGDPIVR